jgi:hypothetical protein
MISMRQWLDLNQWEPTRFDCGKRGADVVLSVAFSTGGAAEEFARQFGGKKKYIDPDLGTAPADRAGRREVPHTPPSEAH